MHNGTCACGQPLRVHAKGQKLPKTCPACYDKANERTTRKRQRSRLSPVAGWAQLVSHHDASVLAEWEAFCLEYDMPLATALESAMDMLIAVTARHERPTILRRRWTKREPVEQGPQHLTVKR